MAPCCTNTVTPKMIRNGEMKIGDRISFTDPSMPASASSQPEENSIEVAVPTPQADLEGTAGPVSAPPSDSVLVSAPASASTTQTTTTTTSTSMAAASTGGASTGAAQMPAPSPSPSNIGGTIPRVIPPRCTPLAYKQMTPYMDQVTITSVGEDPTIQVPQTPLTTEEFSETINVADTQAYIGFLRTQIGRYMRIEQLIGSDTVEDRYGFLVGIGTNFIILQEVTTGNIMVIDLFSIRLTYIYYSEPILPEFAPQ